MTGSCAGLVHKSSVNPPDKKNIILFGFSGAWIFTRASPADGPGGKGRGQVKLGVLKQSK